MSKIHGSILETIGGTPLVEIRRLNDGGARVLVKVEYFNPGGSVKDRIALALVEAATPSVALLTGKSPANPVRVRLQKAGAQVYTASENGVMTVFSDGQSVSVQP